ncbi:restriction endonuclease subunit S [Faecalibacterium sp. BIOML-A3]|uniref:restriction endonuclease subunit S n=1 Tax=unclassified Faecalibacterium TaxID=2646395 RepID=UPI0012B12675|nr:MULTISPECIES: restriction endonuclease subunit S [unclassified Faecalibacterium]MSD29317.1 restriction endonuclease subunit S [Faecalibacterium sp. BIOML-A4]MSD47580.1 restriction endonuclease subunit S [Faecalibacterium sp. BIOML-A3]
MQDNGKKPALRFKGFTDPWEQRKLDEAFDFTVPNNTLSRAELNQESGSVRNVHYGDVLIKYGSVLDAQNDELPFITGRSKDDFKGALLQNGDIIIADTAEDETTGKVCEIVNIQDKDVVAGLHTMVCRPKNKTAEGYFGYYMNSSSYHHQLLPLMQGIKVLSLSKTNVQKTTVKYPKDKAEQQKIADCLRRIDTLITLHQRKYEKLVNIKKSMLDKMFPQNGASVPEIRFKGFTDPWEQRKLGEIANFSKGVGYSKNDLCEEGTPIILYGRLYTKYETCIFDVDTFVKEKAGSVYSKGGEVIVPASGETAEDISIASVVVKPGILLGGDLNIVSPTTEYDSAFLALTISSGAAHKYLSSLAQGKSVVHLHNADIQSVSAKFPTKREQEKIHLLFGKIDTLITLHQRKLEKLQNIKKSCLEKMFV